MILWGLMALLATAITAYAASPYLAFNPALSRIPLNPAVAWHFTILNARLLRSPVLVRTSKR